MLHNGSAKVPPPYREWPVVSVLGVVPNRRGGLLSTVSIRGTASRLTPFRYPTLTKFCQIPDRALVSIRVLPGYLAFRGTAKLVQRLLPRLGSISVVAQQRNERDIHRYGLIRTQRAYFPVVEHPKQFSLQCQGPSRKIVPPVADWKSPLFGVTVPVKAPMV
jgi:hypothetical protein